MSFLTPLYLLGALAVALPVVFHMIRRTPRRRREFSSVMFLEPSPPRITRRSRIEHWVLLLLRSLAVCLLAMAFARPFWRTSEDQPLTDGESRDFVLLVDTSASMRREGVWGAAVARASELLETMQPHDRVSLIAFDLRPRTLVDLEQWTGLQPAQRVAAAKTAVADLSPGWGATDLGGALIDAAERLDSQAADDETPRTQTIIVISDLQAGSRMERLQSYQWPPQVRVQLEPVGRDVSPDNAGIQPFAAVSADAAADATRVRITNSADARGEQFTLRWLGGTGTTQPPQPPTDNRPQVPEEAILETARAVIVPPGQSRVVSAPPRPTVPAADRLLLEGDDHDFDNRCYLAAPVIRTLRVGVLSERAADDPQGAWYYAERALASTPRRTVQVLPFDAALGDAPESPLPELIVMAGLPLAEQTQRLRKYLDDGGTVLFVPLAAADVVWLYEIAGVLPAEAAEATVGNYVMLTEIDWTHPLFAALDHPRFSDFTRVRFWKHRVVDPRSLPGLRVLARFDDGQPAVGEMRIGEGRVVLFTSGWHPEDSQLALSTKFVPMLNGLLESAAGLVDRPVLFSVGDPVDLASLIPAGERAQRVTTPGGEMIVPDEEGRFSRTDQPGRYIVAYGAGKTAGEAEFVVNLDPNESRTSPLPRQVLESMGVRLDLAAAGAQAAVDGTRQLRGSELELRQKLWRWLIVVVIVLLVLETWLAGRATRASGDAVAPSKEATGGPTSLARS